MTSLKIRKLDMYGKYRGIFYLDYATILLKCWSAGVNSPMPSAILINVEAFKVD
jgi:hypothetical protein